MKIFFIFFLVLVWMVGLSTAATSCIDRWAFSIIGIFAMFVTGLIALYMLSDKDSRK